MNLLVSHTLTVTTNSFHHSGQPGLCLSSGKVRDHTQGNPHSHNIHTFSSSLSPLFTRFIHWFLIHHLISITYYGQDLKSCETGNSWLEKKLFTVLKRCESPCGGVYRNKTLWLVTDRHGALLLAESQRRPGFSCLCRDSPRLACFSVSPFQSDKDLVVIEKFRNNI